MSQSTGYNDQTSTVTRTRGTNGLAIAGLVCGLVGLLFLPVILGPLAVIFGAVALNKAKQGAGLRGMAISAIVLGIVDIAIFVALLALAADSGAFSTNF
ncbi:DUF4190 domain-containing protein [Modestobacter versicolor]|uniref:DUF4190 domain-containing protein n=1 Tax=Modestobacter versicolor TaxID=429133 RepID=A0A323VCX4_9ACTN|nr:DUF4190 domain-containing protein [Modestobacter versicolor]MBB3676201.1 hypothetical protein [Modestobacter versicolor]PZA21923.1 hypothetical protein DMO24_07730 [Modestobacter versicolor]